MHGNSRNTDPATQMAPRQEPEPRPYYVRHEFGGSSELSTTLVHALSDVTGADVTEAEAGLADHVDPDALNRLFGSGDDRYGNGHLSFDVWDHRVTVYDDGQISIAPPARVPA